MGQKVNPKGMRLKYLYEWDSMWFSKNDYTKNLLEDLKIKKYIKDKFYRAGIVKVTIERFGRKKRLVIHTARPGIIIGKGGETIEKLKQDLQKFSASELQIDIKEIENPQLNAQLLAETMALRIERRVMYRRVMKQAVFLAMRAGALGVKVSCAGRLEGAEIARCEWYREGKVPLQTFRADIDYGFAEALTKYGKIGIKVWIFKGERLKKDEEVLSGESREEVLLAQERGDV